MPISSEMKQLVKALVTEIVDDCYERGMATCGIESDSGEALIAAIEKLEASIQDMATKNARKDARLADLEMRVNETHSCHEAAVLGLLVRRMPELAVTNVDHIKLTWHQISNGKNWAVLNDDDEFLGQGDTAEAALKEAMGV